MKWEKLFFIMPHFPKTSTNIPEKKSEKNLTCLIFSG